ncbi:MAG: CHAT domain-containing protein [Promethearchaeia archaeon]
MVVTSKKKHEFLSNFRQNIIQANKLLNDRNHRWGDKLLTNLYFDIEKSEWLDLDKKRQLAHMISNTWWRYLNSLSAKYKEKGLDYDIIRYVDGLKRFFIFLEKLNDMYLFETFAENLLQRFIQMENLSVGGITKFINSLSGKVKSGDNYDKLIEYQIILMILRKTVKPTNIFQLSFQKLEDIVIQIEPGRRALFLYILIENVNMKYHLKEDSNKFVQKVQKMLINRIPTNLRAEFSNLGRISINERNYQSICEDILYLINYLNEIGEKQWLIPLNRNLFQKFKKFESLENATKKIKKVIQSLIKHNHFQVAFEVYDLIEDELMYQGDLGYDLILIELWVEATTNFSQMYEKGYLLKSLEKLRHHLSLPQSKSEIFHYFYTWNYIWELKTKFFSLETQHFWKMSFYRILFEMGEIGLALKISTYFEEDLRANLDDLGSLYKIGQSLKEDIYQYPRDDELFNTLNQYNSNIQKVILYVDDKAKISYHIVLDNLQTLDGQFNHEYWNDSQVVKIYQDIFLNNSETYGFNLREFGKLLYAFLPLGIRRLFKTVSNSETSQITHIYFVYKDLIIPLELIYQTNFLGHQFSLSYDSSLTLLTGVSSKTTSHNPSVGDKKTLIIESINSQKPVKWNEQSKKKELLYPFIEGQEELDFLTDLHHNIPQVDKMTILKGLNSTRENILSNLSQHSFRIITFIGNFFFSEKAPQQSYILTNDDQLITIKEILASLKNNKSIKPFLVFDIKMYDSEGEQIFDMLKPFSQIAQSFDTNPFSGVLVRNFPIFNNLTKNLLLNFYNLLIQENPQGIALLKARKALLSDSQKEGTEGLNTEQILTICSFTLFGNPWKIF